VLANRVIERKRDGAELDEAELREFLDGFLSERVSVPQMSAFLMAVLFRGMSRRELETLLSVMIESGAVLDLSSVPGAKVDKHSTGGVGDKVSLALAPLVAELGVPVPMMSGRGLGHTGGTLDKLESIPGFRIDLDLRRFREVLTSVGCAMIGQTAEIAPLDRELYALRSATGTVPSIPLIAASIMSKKLAEDLDGLVLDVKMGRGAFLADDQRAVALARTMVALGTARGVPTVAVLTAMDEPLGRTAGNALEVVEAIQCLRGEGPEDLAEVTAALAGHMLELGGKASSAAEGERLASQALAQGQALDRFVRLIEAQGGDPSVVDHPERLPRARHAGDVFSSEAGVVQGIDPLALGWGVVELGGGRTGRSDPIDPSVGFEWQVKRGDSVHPGDVIGRVHARTPAQLERGRTILAQAVSLADAVPPPALPVVRRVIRAGDPTID